METEETGGDEMTAEEKATLVREALKWVGSLFNNADLNQFDEQLDMSDDSNIAYQVWCAQYAKEKIKGTQSVWDSPNSVTEFRQVVHSWKGDRTWSTLIGKIDGTMQLRSGVPFPTGVDGGGSGGGGGINRGGQSAGEPWSWPWQPGAWDASSNTRKMVWLGGAFVALWLVWKMVRMLTRRRRSRRRRNTRGL